MAPITYRVVDSAGRGLCGMRVQLTCYDEPGQDPVCFYSITNADGEIDFWFLNASVSGRAWSASGPEPQFVDAEDHPYVRISYDTGRYFGRETLPWNRIPPWVPPFAGISTDLTLIAAIGPVQHTIALQFAENNMQFGLEHITETRPVSGMAISNLITPDEGDTDTDSGNLLSPPPLLLSSPSFIEDTSDGSEYRSCESCEDVDSDIDRGRKRKAFFPDDNVTSGKRCRFEPRSC